ncbi:hypothetical protein [Marinomonas atlantica]|nr:hypothetical protein [Marinomonas atlantica]
MFQERKEIITTWLSQVLVAPTDRDVTSQAEEIIEKAIESFRNPLMK